MLKTLFLSFEVNCCITAFKRGGKPSLSDSLGGSVMQTPVRDAVSSAAVRHVLTCAPSVCGLFWSGRMQFPVVGILDL